MAASLKTVCQKIIIQVTINYSNFPRKLSDFEGHDTEDALRLERGREGGKGRERRRKTRKKEIVKGGKEEKVEAENKEKRRSLKTEEQQIREKVMVIKKLFYKL